MGLNIPKKDELKNFKWEISGFVWLNWKIYENYEEFKISHKEFCEQANILETKNKIWEIILIVLENWNNKNSVLKTNIFETHIFPVIENMLSILSNTDESNLDWNAIVWIWYYVKFIWQFISYWWIVKDFELENLKPENISIENLIYYYNKVKIEFNKVLNYEVKNLLNESDWSLNKEYIIQNRKEVWEFFDLVWHSIILAWINISEIEKLQKSN